MGEIRIVGPGKARGYTYPVCKKEVSYMSWEPVLYMLRWEKICFFAEVFHCLIKSKIQIERAYTEVQLRTQ